MDDHFFWRALEYYGWTGWGGTLAAGILLVATAIGIGYYLRTPLLIDRHCREESFWLSQRASDKCGYRGVLFSDEIISAWVGWGGFYFVRRLTVLLKHEDSSRDEILFRCEENPNRRDLDDTISAFSTWIDTARKYDVPAVYRAGKELYILSEKESMEIKADPVAFLAEFQKRATKGCRVF